MAEVVATLSLASCILQIIDFASKFVNTAYKIHQTRTEYVEEVKDLFTINKNLHTLLPEIARQSSEENEENQIHSGIATLSKECVKLIEELLASLSELGVVGGSGKREAIWTALKQLWKRDKIMALQVRVKNFRDQLTLQLLVALRSVVTLPHYRRCTN